MILGLSISPRAALFPRGITQPPNTSARIPISFPKFGIPNFPAPDAPGHFPGALGDESPAALTGEHLVHRRGDVCLCQLLVGAGVVQPDLGAALQRHPHAATRAHHAGDAAPAVLPHLERVLRGTEPRRRRGEATVARRSSHRAPPLPPTLPPVPAWPC